MGIPIDLPEHMAAACNFAMDQDGRPLFVLIAKRTFHILNQSSLALAPTQQEVNLAGEFWGDAGVSSYKYEPEFAFFKPSTDVVLLGHGCAQNSRDRFVDVSIRVGDVIKKSVRVFGDRTWVKRMGIVDMTNPSTFERIPLIYERAFGGWDTAQPDPLASKFECRNPVGVGFKRVQWEEGMTLPNLEDPQNLIGVYGDSPAPAGFGFVSPDWYPRSRFAGTYDKEWEQERAPMLPEDFDVRFFNAASHGMVSPSYLRGDEAVVLENVSNIGPFLFSLPGVAAPTIRIQLRTGPDHVLESRLDTVVINADDCMLVMLWRTSLPLKNGPHDVVAVNVECPQVPRQILP
ncbi:MAG: DUF2169 domain-containing protein [Pirellulaceae bacterium]